MNKLKVTLRKFYELGWPALADFRAWLSLSKTDYGFNFDAESLSSPSLNVATVTNAAGEPVVFAPVEKVLLVRQFVVNPTATPEEALAAGNLIDSTLERQAQLNGIDSILLVVPKDFPEAPAAEYEQVKIYVRKVSKPFASLGFGSYTDSPATQYLN